MHRYSCEACGRPTSRQTSAPAMGDTFADGFLCLDCVENCERCGEKVPAGSIEAYTDSETGDSRHACRACLGHGLTSGVSYGSTDE